MQVILIVFISLLVVALLSLICILFVRKIKATDKDKNVGLLVKDEIGSMSILSMNTA